MENCKYCGWIHSDWLSCDKAKALGEVSRKIEPAKVEEPKPEPVAIKTPMTQSQKMKLYWQKKKENGRNPS